MSNQHSPPFTRPEPDGPQPDDWPPIEWAAYQILAAGGTLSAAALEVGRSERAVSNWLRRWRTWWGPDFITTNRPRTPLTAAANPNPSAMVVTTRGLAAANRLTQANLYDQTASKAAEIIAARLDQIASSPTEMALLAPRDLVDLGRVVAMLSQQAGAILGNQDAGQSGLARFGVDVDLTGLDARHDEAEAQTLAAARLIFDQFHERHGTEVVEVTEAG